MAVRSALVALLLAGCAETGVRLSIGLVTDWTPGIELRRVRTTIDDRATVERDVGEGELYAPDGRRIADFDRLEPLRGRRLVLELIGPRDAVIARRTGMVDNRDSTALTLVVARDCAQLACEDGESCVAGRCVAEECITGGEASCPPPECEIASDCPATAECAMALCERGACLAVGGTSTCGARDFCDPARGCVARPLPTPEFEVTRIEGLAAPNFVERDASLTPDELEIVFSRRPLTDDTGALYTSRRASIDAPWSAPEPITVSDVAGGEADPELGLDGLSLFYWASVGQESTPRVLRRDALGGPWAPPTTARIDPAPVAVCCIGFTRDPALVLLTIAPRSGTDDRDLWIADRVGALITPRAALTDLSTTGRESNPALSNEDRYLWFDRVVGDGTRDIFAARRNGSYVAWTDVERISALSEPDADDRDVWASPDGERIYFASDRGNERGQFDLFVAHRR